MAYTNAGGVWTYKRETSYCLEYKSLKDTRISFGGGTKPQIVPPERLYPPPTKNKREATSAKSWPKTCYKGYIFSFLPFSALRVEGLRCWVKMATQSQSVTVRENSSPLSLFMGVLPQVKSQQDLIMVPFPWPEQLLIPLSVLMLTHRLQCFTKLEQF